MLPDIVQQLSITFSFSDLNASQSQICSRNQILKKNLMLNWLRRSMKSFYHVNLMDLLSKSIGVSVRPKPGFGIGEPKLRSTFGIGAETFLSETETYYFLFFQNFIMFFCFFMGY